MDDIIWMGPQPSIAELGAQVGVPRSYPLKQLNKMIGEAVAKGRKIHFLPPYRFDHYLWLEALTGIRAAAVQNYTLSSLLVSAALMRL